MIARVWVARTTVAHAPAYADHFQQHVLAALHSVDGYVGAKLLEREIAAGVELVVMTFWQSLDAIRQFAGPEFERAVVSAEIIPLLLEYDRSVKHYEITATDER
jgi:heme-degrading monooxygenase HmoA